MTTDNDKENSYGYAGFWLRTIAVLIDGFILYLIYFLLSLLATPLIGKSLNNILTRHLSGLFANSSQDMGNVFFTMFFASIVAYFVIFVVTFLIVVIVIGFIYNVCFEISPLKATPGKLILGLEVVNKSGEKINILSASLRHICKFFSALIFFLGFLMAAIMPKKQALHDLVSGCYVRKTGTYSATRLFLAIIIALICVVAFSLIPASFVDQKNVKTYNFDFKNSEQNDFNFPKEEINLKPLREVRKPEIKINPKATQEDELAELDKIYDRFKEGPKENITVDRRDSEVVLDRLNSGKEVEKSNDRFIAPKRVQPRQKKKTLPETASGYVSLNKKRYTIQDSVVKLASENSTVYLYLYNRKLSKEDRLGVQPPVAAMITMRLRYEPKDKTCNLGKLLDAKTRIILTRGGTSGDFSRNFKKSPSKSYQTSCIKKLNRPFTANINDRGTVHSSGYKMPMSWSFKIEGVLRQ